MAISITDLGSNNKATGATVTLTIPAGGVPSGALVAVGTAEHNAASSGGSVTDTASNTYTFLNGVNAGGAVYGAIWYAANVTALVSGNVITYTKVASGDSTTIAAIYGTGVATSSPVDSAVTASASGTSANPSVTSGTPSVAGEMFAAFMPYTAGANRTFTQDSGHNWSGGFDVQQPGTGATQSAGGSQVNAGSSAITFAPTLSGSATWNAMVVGFKPPSAAATPLRTLMGAGI